MKAYRTVGIAAVGALTVCVIAWSISWLFSAARAERSIPEVTAAQAGASSTSPQGKPQSSPRGEDTGSRRNDVLLKQSNLKYLGAFRIPKAWSQLVNLATAPIAYNPANNSLFICGSGSPAVHPGLCGEMSIPPVVDGHGSTDKLNFADALQAMADPTEDHIMEVVPSHEWGNGIYLGGILVYNSQLYGTAYEYYGDTATKSHFKRSLNLSSPSFSGWYAPDDNPGRIAGFMASVPKSLQSRLGGPALTGQCCLAEVGRTSLGPAAFGFDPSRLTNPSRMFSTKALVYYTGEHPTLGPWEENGLHYGSTTQMGGMALPEGSKSILFFGRNGHPGSPLCYGPGTDKRALGGKPDGEGNDYCYDTSFPEKGPHAYPYTGQVWAYNVDDVARAAHPYDVRPYAVWSILGEWMADAFQPAIGGVAYDPQRQLIYVSLLSPDEYEGNQSLRPLMHVYKVELGPP